MALPSDQLFPSRPSSWSGRPLVLLLRLLLVLALAAGYDLGAFALALHTAAPFTGGDVARGLIVLGLAAAMQVMLTIALVGGRRYVLAGITALSTLPLLFCLLVFLA